MTEQSAARTYSQDEFQGAVDAAVAKALPEIVAKLSEKGLASSDDAKFAQGLAMAIAQLTDQGTGRRRVAPEIVATRAKARERMVDLIVKARAEGKPAAYKLRNKVYIGEIVIDPIFIGPDHTQRQTEIEWAGVPNEGMVPANETAEEIHKAFMESIGSMDEPVPESKLLGVTAGGLVIRSGSRAVQPLSIPGVGDGGASQQTNYSGSEGLKIKHRDGKGGAFKEVNVLGTLAKPALQQV